MGCTEALGVNVLPLILSLIIYTDKCLERIYVPCNDLVLRICMGNDRLVFSILTVGYVMARSAKPVICNHSNSHVCDDILGTRCDPFGKKNGGGGCIIWRGVKYL